MTKPVRLIVKLESQLEAEREKREGLEKETDELRAKLYQAKQELVQYQTTHHTTVKKFIINC
jgi:chromosome segregation ATPase